MFSLRIIFLFDSDDVPDRADEPVDCSGAADANGSRESTSAMTFSLPGWCSILKTYSDSRKIHLSTREVGGKSRRSSFANAA
jgi:hypothetical protein